MEFVDTHAHINFLIQEKFGVLLTPEQISQAREFVEQAKRAGVGTIINIGTTVVDSQNSVLLARAYPKIFAVVGIYPTDLHENWREQIAEILELVREKEKNKIVGIGEIGIDLYRPGFNLARQLDGFKAQIELALEHDLALVIHSRAAAHETLEVLREFKGQITRGVMHCFSYDEQIAKDVIELGFCLGIGGAVSYKNNHLLQNVVRAVTLENIVLETDAPWLTPEPYRGSKNTPAHIATIAQFVAQLKNVSIDEVARVTTKNCQKLFKLV